MLKKTKGILADFKNFAIKGNAIELAVAVVVGNAFTGVVNSLVGDVITPLLGLLTNNVDFKELSVHVAPGAVVKYGALIQNVFNFFVIAFTIFVVIKLLGAARGRMRGDVTE